MVVFAVAEDDFETVLKPRLVAAEANLDYIRCARLATQRHRRRAPHPRRHPGPRAAPADDGRRTARDRPAALAPVGEDRTSHTDHEVKLALKPLISWRTTSAAPCSETATSARTRPAVPAGRRWARPRSRTRRGSGSRWPTTTKTPTSASLEVIKSNIGPKGVGRNYRLKTVASTASRSRCRCLSPKAPPRRRRRPDRGHATQGKRIPGELVRDLILAELETGEKSRKVPGRRRAREARRKPRHRLPVRPRPSQKGRSGEGPQRRCRRGLVLAAEPRGADRMKEQVGSSPKTPESSRTTELFIHAGLPGVYYRLRSRYFVLPSDYRVALGGTALASQRGVE